MLFYYCDTTNIVDKNAFQLQETASRWGIPSLLVYVAWKVLRIVKAWKNRKWGKRKEVVCTEWPEHVEGQADYTQEKQTK